MTLIEFIKLMDADDMTKKPRDERETPDWVYSLIELSIIAVCAFVAILVLGFIVNSTITIFQLLD